MILLARMSSFEKLLTLQKKRREGVKTTYRNSTFGLLKNIITQKILYH